MSDEADDGADEAAEDDDGAAARAAAALEARYGPDGAVVAVLRAAEAAAAGDLEASDHWMIVAALLEDEAPSGPAH